MVNPFRECKELNLRLWQCPPFLFILMGLITIIAIIATYLVAVRYQDPSIVIISASIVAIITLSIGYLVVNSVNRLAENNKMKTEFVAIASHQLRTPLNTMLWSLELLAKESFSEKSRTLLDNIHNSSQRLLRLVNDLLNVSRIEQGRISLQREKVSINKLIQDLIQEFTSLAKARNVKIKFKSQKPLALKADPTKLRIIFHNILANAILYSQAPGLVTINIKNNIISIKDDGVGIPKYQQKLVFKKFFRSDNALKRQTQGTGLGLYIAKAMVEAHKGKIWFESQENKGTIFYIKLN